jgi:hypothetical protein
MTYTPFSQNETSTGRQEMTGAVKDTERKVSGTALSLLAGGNDSEKSKAGQRRDKIKEVRPGARFTNV